MRTLFKTLWLPLQVRVAFVSCIGTGSKSLLCQSATGPVVCLVMRLQVVIAAVVRYGTWDTTPNSVIHHQFTINPAKLCMYKLAHCFFCMRNIITRDRE